LVVWVKLILFVLREVSGLDLYTVYKQNSYFYFSLDLASLPHAK